MGQPPRSPREQLNDERTRLLRQVSLLLDKPMTALAVVWLVLLILDFTQGLTERLEAINLIVWLLFLLHFALEFWIAPQKAAYVRRNWLTALALVLPALRILRVFRALRILRAARIARSVTLLRLVTALNRGMRTIQRRMRQRGLGYVLALTVLVTFAGAAGINYFENPQALREAGVPSDGSGLTTYGEAVW